MSSTKRTLIIFLAGIGLTLIAAGLSPLLLARAQEEPATTPEVTDVIEDDTEAEVTPEVAPVEAEAAPASVYNISGEPIEPTGDNSYCMVCHNQPWDTVTLQDGTIQNLFVNPQTIAASVHGESSEAGALGCVDCHGDDAFPHNNPSPEDGRAYALYAVSICANCHVEEVHELEIGLHEQAILAGNRDAAVCTDCHGSHDVQPVVEEPELIAGVCGDCHTTTLVEWRSSEHTEIGPLGCATCHSPHSQRLRAGNTANELCINCHDDVETVFVHRQHSEVESEVTCTDCHMYTGVDGEELLVSTTVLPTGHSMKLDSTPCNTCHEELVDSGEWAQLVSQQGGVELAPVDTPPETASESPADTIPETGSSTESQVQLIQGLLLGLGFGATIAVLFVARGNRSHAPARPVEVVEPPVQPPPAAPTPEAPAPTESQDVVDQDHK